MSVWGAITAIRLVTREPDRLARFYADAIGFAVAEPIAIMAEEMAVLGLSGVGVRRRMTLGEQVIDLDAFKPAGRVYPADADAADLRFQHFAIVTDDATGAFERARTHGATSISIDGAVTLPASAGGVRAVKLRDPEGHPIEFLQFPGGARPRGIDHTAIAVADADASRAFYEAIGLRAGARTLNEGPTQVALDALAEVRVDVVPLWPARTPPHLELLGYRSPIARRAPWHAVNDVVATRTVWAADRAALIRDPDGHFHQLEADD